VTALAFPAREANTTSLVLWYIYFHQHFYRIPP
jgi:hypothetical protein